MLVTISIKKKQAGQSKSRYLTLNAEKTVIWGLDAKKAYNFEDIATAGNYLIKMVANYPEYKISLNVEN